MMDTVLMEYKKDKELHIKTTKERKVAYPDELRYNPYEPTPYHALDTLFAAYELPRDSVVVDYGCGKGRLAFYLDYFFDVPSVGIEMEERLIRAAEKNLHSYQVNHKGKGEKISFIQGLAEEYWVDPDTTCFYFFNPFSIPVFRHVIQQIMESLDVRPRVVDIILYYPNHDYLSFMDNHTTFQFHQDIPITEWTGRDADERFVIYRSNELF